MTTTTIPRTSAERDARLVAINDQVAALGRHEKPTRAQEQQLVDLDREFWAIRGQQVAEAMRGGTSGDLRLDAGASSREEAERAQQGTALFGARRAEGVRGQALDTLEAIERSGSHVGRGALDALARSIEADESDAMARWTQVAGAPAYRSAFVKRLVDPEHGSHSWTPAERDAFARVREAQRALGLTTQGGGFAVPLELDPSVTLAGGGTSNRSLRSAFTVRTIASDAWHGVTSAGVTAGWRTEAAETADGSPVLGEVKIPVHRADAFVPVSFELAMDMPGFLAEMAKLLADAREQLEAEAFINGTGTGQPTGIVTAATAAGSTVDASGAALTLADTFAMKAALPARHRAGASWLLNEDSADAIRQLALNDAAGSAIWADLGAETPPTLLGRGVTESSEMGAPTSTTGRALVYGDMRQMVVVDRIGSSVEVVPHLFGPNGRPTAQRGVYSFWRTGADLVVPDAVRVLTTA